MPKHPCTGHVALCSHRHLSWWYHLCAPSPFVYVHVAEDGTFDQQVWCTMVQQCLVPLCLTVSIYLPIYLSLSLCIRPINWFSIINVAPQVVFTSIFAIILSISLQKIIGTLITIGTWTFHVTQLILYSAKTKSKIIIIYHSDSKILLLIYHYNIYYECA